jgi:hypothetical protein
VFDPGILLLPSNVAKADAAYMASLSPARRSFMALPYGPGDANYVVGQPYRNDPIRMASENARETLWLQVHVWCDSWTRTCCDAFINGFTTWLPSYGMPNFNVGIGDAYPGVVPNYDESNPPAGAILLPKIGADGLLVLPAAYVDPDPPAPAPSTTAIVGPVQFFRTLDVLGDQKFHNWAAVLYKDTAPVGTVDKTGLWIKAPFPSFEPMGSGPILLWKTIAVVP